MQPEIALQFLDTEPEPPLDDDPGPDFGGYVNFLRDVAVESIVGQGARGYHLALESIARRFATAPGGGRG